MFSLGLLLIRGRKRPPNTRVAVCTHTHPPLSRKTSTIFPRKEKSGGNSAKMNAVFVIIYYVCYDDVLCLLYWNCIALTSSQGAFMNF